MIDPKVVSLLKVCETGSFTKAAEQLSLTQPAVSKHVCLLEEELGVRIFLRSRNQLRITPEGELVVSYAKRMLSLSRNLRQELQNRKRGIESLSVGITHTAESNASAEALAQYATTHENVKVRLITETMDRLCGMLKNYELDVAIVEGRVHDPKLRCLLLDTDCLLLALAPNHPLAAGPSVSIGQLKRENLILRSTGSGTRNMFASALESQGIHIGEFHVLMEIDNIATIKDLVRRNFGVSILARSACMDEYSKEKIALRPIEDLPMIREINLVYHQDFAHPELLQDIAQSYKETSAAAREKTK